MLYTGKTLEEVLQSAAEKEYCTVEELMYYVVNQSEETVSIEVYTIVDVIEFAQTYVREGIESLSFDARVSPTLKDDVIHLRIESDRNPILIGKNGRSLQAINELVRLAVNHRFQRHFRILLDVNTYKEEKYARITSIAKRIAHDVQKTKVTATMDPMPSDERRAVHNALTGMPHIKTESIGMGKQRQITIMYEE